VEGLRALVGEGICYGFWLVEQEFKRHVDPIFFPSCSSDPPHFSQVSSKRIFKDGLLELLEELFRLHLRSSKRPDPLANGLQMRDDAPLLREGRVGY